MDLEDVPQKSQSSRLPEDTPVTKAMVPLLPLQPAHPPPRAQDPRQACHQKHRQGRWLTHAWHSVGCSPSSALTTQKAAVIPTVQTGMPGGAQRLSNFQDS